MILIILSLLLVALGQSSYISYFGICAASLGYACFWLAILPRYPRTRDRFWAFVGWYVIVQAIQLSWFTSIRYMGPGILVVYAGLIFVLALQFGCLVFFFNNSNSKIISLRNCFALSGCWVIFEWLRIFLFTGFTWNPAGLALASSPYAIQFAALFGVYGLCFWVMFVNAFAVYAGKSWKRGAVWAGLALLPYLYGMGQREWVKRNVPIEQMLSVALVQTGILPEQKDRFKGLEEAYIPPLIQWERIWEQLYRAPAVDLIVLPEAAVAISARRYFYPLETVEVVWQNCFGRDAIDDFPPLEPPFASMIERKGVKTWKVTNFFIAQALANHFKAQVIIGFVDEKHNATFSFGPQNIPIERYEKRILVPMGEYVPFSGNEWVSNFLLEQFDLGDAFSAGTESKIFSLPCPIGVSICVEETYSQFMRELRQQGARLFVNVTNDVWFPGSHLPQHHFQHGQIRSAENGVCSLRSCNTGVTGAVDCCGQIVKTMPLSEENIDVLYLSLPLKSFKTLYTWWGDGAILSFSALCLIFRMRRRLV